MRISPLLITASLALLPLKSQASTLLGQDNFDGAPYSDNAPLVTGWNQLPQGRWSLSMKGNSSATTSTAQALSGTRSLQLSTGALHASEDNQAQAIFALTPDGVNRTPPFETSDALQIRFSFYVKDQTFAHTFYLQGDNQSAVITIGNNINVSFGSGSSRLFSGIQADTWYTVQLDMPNLATGSDHQYTVSLFDTSNAELGSVSGLIYKPATTYRFFTFYHTKTENQTLYIDNVSATAIPEPGTAALAFIGLGLGGFLLRHHVR